ncbi:hypothetical protein [Nocardiopsis valliformis]|uniref:hypothetical protein n=1 Tax=Nocardiopsis valliformis TaxID=239974 RepID=UPI000349CA89|nr:hypothetical protein [Nocardiopsis valliformis]
MPERRGRSPVMHDVARLVGVLTTVPDHPETARACAKAPGRLPRAVFVRRSLAHW